MLEQIKQLERAGDRAELQRLAEILPQGDALARVFIALSKLQEDAAQTGADYREALTYVQRAIAAADPGSLMWTWSQGRTAALAADMGNYHLAERAAGAFMAALPDHPTAQALLPWAKYAAGRALANRGHFQEAIAQYREAQAAAGCPADLAERIQLAVVWAFAQAGMFQAATSECPARVSHVPDGLLHAATAIVMATAGDWRAARTAARIALPSYAGPGAFMRDFIEAAELLLIIKLAAQHLGEHDQAAVWFEHTAAIFAGGIADNLSGLLPTLPRGGGERFAAASSSRGLPAGYRRCGLRGVCG